MCFRISNLVLFKCQFVFVFHYGTKIENISEKKLRIQYLLHIFASKMYKYSK
jgi:hypothetical protein